MDPSAPKGRKRSNAFQMLWRNALIIVLFVLLVVVAGYLTMDIYLYQQGNHLTPRRHAREVLSFIRSPDRLLSSASSTQGVQDWMTFDYVNKNFHLPSAYLRTALQIQDVRYPNMSIRRYARDSNQSFSSAVASVQAAVREYAPTSTRL